MFMFICLIWFGFQVIPVSDYLDIVFPIASYQQISNQFRKVIYKGFVFPVFYMGKPRHEDN